MRRRALIAFGVALTLAVGTAAAQVDRQRAPKAAAATPVREPVTLKEALAVSQRLGPLAPGRDVHLVLALRPRHQQQLEQLLRSGGSGIGGFEAKYGPDPQGVLAALALARRAGFRTIWSRGQTLASLDAPARVVERFFRVSLSEYVTPRGRHFFAADRTAHLPRPLRRVASGLSGLDDFSRANVAAIPAGGVSPADVMSFYNITALRKLGLDGSGEVVVFPEYASPDDESQLRSDLNAFDSRYGLPAYDLTVRADPSWQPLPHSDSFAAGALVEAALDLEIVHAIAPKAKLVVYESSRNIGIQTKAQLAMVTEFPTAIISDSTGFCESLITDRRALPVLEAPWQKQAVQNMTHYVASGDTGAYDCDEQHPAAVDYGAALPVNTGVGGTSVFLSQNGTYYREVAWGNPFSQTGSGGGFSRLYSRPSYETGPGVPSAQTGRIVPDVAGLSDMNTGWSILVANQLHQVGGTSAAAPLWAGLTALINQHLRADGLRRVGAASQALYWIGQRQSQLHAFHDVTVGNNLLYKAGRGWDAATGWGTPDAPKLDAAWHAYLRQNP